MKINRWLASGLLILSASYGAGARAHGPGFHHGWGGPGWGHHGWGRHGWYGGRSGFSFYFGGPAAAFGYPYGSYYYGPPAYYYPPSVVGVPVSPPLYIEEAPMSSEAHPSGYWYYCTNPEGYYPYVKECTNQWRQVAPNPPNAR